MRIKKEVNLLKELKHMHVVEYYNSEIINIRNNKYMHICMELFDASMKDSVDYREDIKKEKMGKNLDQLIKWLQPRNKFIILKQVVSGLEYLHEKNDDKNPIVHFDLKPANILLKITDNPFNGPKFIHAAIADFGLSKSLKDEASCLSMSVYKGTKDWTSPEVEKYGTNGKTFVRPSSDIYILGLVFYYFLTDGHKAAGFKKENKSSPWDELPKLNINKRTDFFDDVILKMLSEEPKNRPKASELNSNILLNQYIKDETVEIEKEEVTNIPDYDPDKLLSEKELLSEDETTLMDEDNEKLQRQKIENLELENMKLKQELAKMMQSQMNNKVVNGLENDNLQSEVEDPKHDKLEDVKSVKKVHFNNNTELFPNQKGDNQKVEQVRQAYNIVADISNTPLGDNDPSIIPGAQNYLINFKRNNIKKAYELAGMVLLYNESYFISHLQTMGIHEEDAKTIYNSLSQRCKIAGLWDIHKIYGIGDTYAQGLKSSFNDTQKYRNSYQYFNSMAVGKFLKNEKNRNLMNNFLGQLVNRNTWGTRIVDAISSKVVESNL
uniref:Protein kinase domain-containing protein n=1 Tax=Acrobeloides nanus TaxID=290746 RepID=A0A914C104_9BILA